MNRAKSDSPRIVLVGAGHVNATLLHRVAKWRERGWHVDFVAPGPFVYSGLATGVLSGEQPLRANVVDLAGRAEALGAKAFRDRLVAVHAEDRALALESGLSRRFDAASVNLGSHVPALEEERDAEQWLFKSKPICQLAALRQRLEKDGSISKVDVIGGGVSGVEIACCLAGLRRRLKRMFELRLTAPEGPLSDWSRRGRGLARRCLEESGVALLEGKRAERLRAGSVLLSDGTELRTDIAVSAVGVKPEVGPAQGLQRGPRGGLAIDRHLQAVSCPGLFAGGDLVDTDPLVDRVGVYAVREARVIVRNIEALLAGRAMRSWRPSKSYAQILNLGDGTGLLRWRSLALRGRWALALKNAIDLRFVDSVGGKRGSSPG